VRGGEEDELEKKTDKAKGIEDVHATFFMGGGEFRSGRFFRD